MATTTTLQQLIEAAADDLGLLIQDAVSSVNGNVVTVGKVNDVSPDGLHLRDAFLVKQADGSFRRITAQSGNDLTVTDGTTFSTNDPVDILLLLSPDEWSGAVNTALRQLYQVVRYSTPIVSGQNEYTMPAGLETRQQVLGVELQSSSGSRVTLEDVGTIKWLEDSNTLTAHLTVMPSVANDVDLVVVYKKPYDPLTSWDSTTTCPFVLAWRQSEVEAARRLFKKYGQEAKARFAAVLAVAERELARLKVELLPPLRTQDYAVDFEWSPDMPLDVLRWSW